MKESGFPPAANRNFECRSSVWIDVDHTMVRANRAEGFDFLVVVCCHLRDGLDCPSRTHAFLWIFTDWRFCASEIS